MSKLYSTEQVSKYHPDKVADQISDAIVGYVLSKNIKAKCAIETLIKDGVVIIAGEIGGFELDKDIAKDIVKNKCDELKMEVNKVIYLISSQSEQIRNAVDSDENIGAGDQGIMFGYATNETESYLPYGFDLANKIIEKIEGDVIKNDILKGDAKTQVTTNNNKEIVSVLVSVCHNEKHSLDFVKKHITNLLVDLVHKDKLLINPSGVWTIGGPVADCGLTGRKIVCDQYGGYVPVGGGAFSGKDLTKVDRSASYYARNVAIDLVKKFNLKYATIQVGYAIGISEPMSIHIESDGDVNVLTEYVKQNYDFKPRAMIQKLNLKPSDYEILASGCHYKKGYVGDWNK